MQEIEAIIDGKKIKGAHGATILQAAQSSGIYIPTICSHPALENVGACRVCLVEAEGAPKLLAACSTPLTQGMVIHTKSERVIKGVRGVIELLLIRHPLDCFSCPSNGKCSLQDAAYAFGVTGEEKTEKYIQETNTRHAIEDANPFYARDMDKCILCGRCVRTCDALAQYHAIDFQDRGIQTTVSSQVGTPIEESDCVFCGQCVQMCPVGALYDKPSLGFGRAWEITSTKTICPYCGVGCEIYLDVNKNTGKIAGVHTDYESRTGLNGGRCCVKGRYAYGFVQSEERLNTPLIKQGGAFKAVSWDEALSFIALKLSEIKSSHGSDAIGFLSSARCTNEENYLMSRLARSVIGTNNIDHCAHL